MFSLTTATATSADPVPRHREQQRGPAFLYVNPIGCFAFLPAPLRQAADCQSSQSRSRAAVLLSDCLISRADLGKLMSHDDERPRPAKGGSAPEKRRSDCHAVCEVVDAICGQVEVCHGKLPRDILSTAGCV